MPKESKPDLEYRNDGLFTRFMPNTPSGEDAWKAMAKDDGVAAVLNIHAKNVIAQLRRSGYTVAKAKPTQESIDDILKALEA